EMTWNGMMHDAQAGADCALQAANDRGIDRTRARLTLKAKGDKNAAPVGADERFGKLFVPEVISRPQDRASLGNILDPLLQEIAKVPRRAIRTAEKYAWRGCGRQQGDYGCHASLLASRLRQLPSPLK